MEAIEQEQENDINRAYILHCLQQCLKEKGISLKEQWRCTDSINDISEKIFLHAPLESIYTIKNDTNDTIPIYQFPPLETYIIQQLHNIIDINKNGPNKNGNFVLNTKKLFLFNESISFVIKILEEITMQDISLSEQVADTILAQFSNFLTEFSLRTNINDDPGAILHRLGLGRILTLDSQNQVLSLKREALPQFVENAELAGVILLDTDARYGVPSAEKSPLFGQLINFLDGYKNIIPDYTKNDLATQQLLLPDLIKPAINTHNLEQEKLNKIFSQHLKNIETTHESKNSTHQKEQNKSDPIYFLVLKDIYQTQKNLSKNAQHIIQKMMKPFEDNKEQWTDHIKELTEIVKETLTPSASSRYHFPFFPKKPTTYHVDETKLKKNLSKYYRQSTPVSSRDKPQYQWKTRTTQEEILNRF